MKKILSAVIFLTVLVFLFHLTNVMLFEKQHFGTAKNIAYEEEGKIDVFFVGSSHIFFGINPMEIWEEAGISGYNLTTHQQPLWSAKLLLQHALKKQQPKLIVLDVLMATNFSRPLLGTNQGTNMTHLALDPIPLSIQKIRGVLKTDMITEKGEILLPIILSHSRLQQGLLTWEDFHFFSGDRSHPMKGYNYTENLIPYSHPGTVPETTHELPDGLEEVLIDFIEFCREENLPLLFIKTPLVGNVELYEQINYIGRIAEAYGVPFVDFNHLYDELGIDFEKDFADSGHLNVYGAEKVSLFLAEYLRENYDLTDHRGDLSYASWEQSARHYRALTDLRNSTSLTDSFEAASDPNLLTVVLSGGAVTNAVSLPEEVTQAMRQAGLTGVPSVFGSGAYYAVIRGGRVILEKSFNSGIHEESFLIRDTRFELQVSSREPDGGSYMTVLYIGKGGGYSSFDPGMLVITYDTDRMEAVDAVLFRFDGRGEIEHLQ